jgi:adenosylcobyric acid synthase
MNPVLLKPGTDRRSHIVLLGRPHGELRAGQYATGRAELADAAYASLAGLRQRYDVVVCEGAGSPTEINLRAGDYTNLGLARRAQLPVVVVGDIDRGGLFAAMFGTLALLDAADQALIAGWIVNKFRGDPALLQPGLRALHELTGRPVLGVLPWLTDMWLDAEDSLAAGWGTSAERGGAAPGRLRVAVVRLPRMSNTTDLDALATEPGVSVTLTADADVAATADLTILPGTRATVEDLAWLRERGIADAVTARAAAGRAVLGICGGYQMLAEQIHDPVESGRGTGTGLALLPTTVVFHADKTLGRPQGTWHDHPVRGYEIHHGVATRSATTVGELEPFIDGWRAGSVWGTSWHGTFENDEFRRAWLTHVAAGAGLAWRPTASAPGFAQQREGMLDRLADAVEGHLDTTALLRLIENGSPPGLPFVPPGAPPVTGTAPRPDGDR